MTAGQRDVAAYVRALPRKRVAVGALFLDDLGRVLLVRPTYKDHWDLPGGVVDEHESPRDAWRREVAEELGLDRCPEEVVAVDWIPPRTDVDDGLVVVFSGGLLDPADVAAIRLPAEELSEFRFVPPAEVAEFLPDRIARRVDAAVSGRADGWARYLEHGRRPG